MLNHFQQLTWFALETWSCSKYYNKLLQTSEDKLMSNSRKKKILKVLRRECWLGYLNFYKTCVNILTDRISYWSNLQSTLFTLLHTHTKAYIPFMQSLKIIFSCSESLCLNFLMSLASPWRAVLWLSTTNTRESTLSTRSESVTFYDSIKRSAKSLLQWYFK
jgi:hypothetical protein